MKKQEVIDELNKTQEKFYEVWMNLDLDKSSRDTAINVYVGIMLAKTYVDKLDESQAEKEEVPDFAAPFIEKLKTTGRRYGVELEKAYASGEDADLSEWLWFNENVLTVFRALENGYTVKKEPRWVVKRRDGDYVNDYQEATLCVGIGLTPELDVLPPFKFTDKSKAEAVATLVDGSVEEV